jgi:hypothetical protein
MEATDNGDPSIDEEHPTMGEQPVGSQIANLLARTRLFEAYSSEEQGLVDQ